MRTYLSRFQETPHGQSVSNAYCHDWLSNLHTIVHDKREIVSLISGSTFI